MESTTTTQTKESHLKNNPIYTYRGKKYEILSSQTDVHGDTHRSEHILSDFLYCEETRDWDTIGHRISNGLKWGWLREIEKRDEKEFW